MMQRTAILFLLINFFLKYYFINYVMKASFYFFLNKVDIFRKKQSSIHVCFQFSENLGICIGGRRVRVACKKSSLIWTTTLSLSSYKLSERWDWWLNHAKLYQEESGEYPWYFSWLLFPLALCGSLVSLWLWQMKGKGSSLSWSSPSEDA